MNKLNKAEIAWSILKWVSVLFLMYFVTKWLNFPSTYERLEQEKIDLSYESLVLEAKQYLWEVCGGGGSYSRDTEKVNCNDKTK